MRAHHAELAPTWALEGVRLTPQGLAWSEGAAEEGAGLSVAAFLRIFRAVLALHQAGNWLLGDALALADRRWGNRCTGSKYEEAAQRTGLSLTTLRGIVCTCRAYPLEWRHGGLSFSHHREAMMGSASPEQREQWLLLAEQEGMSCAAFRRFVRAEASRESRTQREAEEPEEAPQGAPGLYELSRFVVWASRHRVASLSLEMRRELWKRLEPVARYREELRRSLRQEGGGRGRKGTTGGGSKGGAHEEQHLSLPRRGGGCKLGSAVRVRAAAVGGDPDRGKSGHHKAARPVKAGDARLEGRVDGKCHRKQTALSPPGGEVRVKR